MQAQTPHQTLDREACHLGALLVHLVPDLIYAIDLHVGLPDGLD